MRCPHCGEKIEDLEVAIDVVNKFVHRRVTYGELKAASAVLERLRIKYKKEGSDG